MKTYKRWLALFLALTMLLLVGCGGGDGKKTDKKDKEDADDAFEAVKERLVEMYSDDGDMLVLDNDGSALELDTVLRVDGEKFTLSWEVKKVNGDIGEVLIEETDDGSYLWYDAGEEDVVVTLKATIKNGDGDKAVHTVKVRVPGRAGSGTVRPMPDNPPVNEDEPFDVTEEVTITFTHTMGAKLQEVLNYHIEKFNKMYPNIKIVHQSAGGWGDINGQINTEIAGGNPPNIVYCYPDHVAMYNIAKAVVPLDDLIDSDVLIEDKYGNLSEIIGLTEGQKEDLIDSFYNEGMVYGDGKMYTMPLSKSTEVLYYDKTFFAEHNLQVPTTWDELWAVCAKIKEIAPDDYPLGYDSEENLFITLATQMGSGYTSAENGGQYLFNNAANRQMVAELREYYKKGYFTTEQLYGAYTSNLFVEQTDKRCYMCIGSSGGASYQASNNDTADGSYAFEVGVAPIPQVDPSNPKTISQGPSLCILKDAKTTDQEVIASWLFVKYLTTNVEFQAEFSMTSGYMPVLESVVENDNYNRWLDKRNGKEYLISQCVYMGIENSDAYFVPPAFKGSSKAREQVGNLILKCLGSATVDIDKAFKEAIEECEQ